MFRIFKGEKSLKPKRTKPPGCSKERAEPLWLKRSLWLAILMGLAIIPFIAFATATDAAPRADTRPNIVLFVADDGGFSDYGAFGGEAATPNIDSFATGGMLFGNFHVQTTCTPSRAELLTGVDNHLAGVGTMQGNAPTDPAHPQYAQDGYLGYLNNRVVTIATLLQAGGYHTYHVGKWHLAQEIKGTDSFARGSWPIDRGFDQSYGVLNGGGEHFGAPDRNSDHFTAYFENDQIIYTGGVPAGYFSAKDNTNRALQFIDAGITADAGQRKPFFLLYADTLPHEPNQVPDKILDPVNGIDDATLNAWADYYYAKGWDQVRADRLANQKAIGIAWPTTTLAPRMPMVPEYSNNADPLWSNFAAYPSVPSPLQRFQNNPAANWGAKSGGAIDTVDKAKEVLAKMYAVYRGMIQYNDAQMGRIIQHLKDIGEYNNTLFIFLSDNGGDLVEWDWNDRTDMPNWVGGVNNSYANLGRQNSFFSTGYDWGQVGITPLDFGKTYMHEGGTSAPLLILYPNGNIVPGSQNYSFATIMDIAATVMDYGGVAHPVNAKSVRTSPAGTRIAGVSPSWAACNGTYAGRTGICPMNGTSLRPLLEGTMPRIHDGEPIGFELWGNTNKALYVEEGANVYKLRKVADFGASLNGLNTPWALYNVVTDMSEQINLASTNPTKLNQMINLYNTYEANVGFIGAASPAVAQKKNAQPGSSATYTFTFTNPATSIADTFSFVCQSSLPCTIAPPITSTLAPGASRSVVATVTMPSWFTSGGNIAQINVLRTTRTTQDRNFSIVTKFLAYSFFPAIAK